MTAAMRAPWHLRLGHQRLSTRYYSTATIPPLRILFCGSDAFSAHSLRALKNLPPSLVSSIDVVHRSPKRTGRGLKAVTTPPIQAVATQLGLRTHSIPTFTGWTPPPTDLIVAVSFGLLVPPRILSAARYGGVNLHPSYLPDLAGPAPIHWALLQGDTHAGATLQTLHPSRFDGGEIVAQSARPGLALDGHDLASATEALAEECAGLLVRSIEEGSFARPGRKQGSEGRHARKLVKADSNFEAAWTVKDLMRRAMVVGPVWEGGMYYLLMGKTGPWKRLQYEGWEVVESDELEGMEISRSPLGLTAGIARIHGSKRLVFKCADGWVMPQRVKVEGETWMDIDRLLARTT